MAKFVFPYQAGARFAHQLAIEAFLQPFNPLTVNVGETNQIGRNMSGGIKAAGLFTQVDSRQIQFIDPFCLLRRDLARQIDKPPGWIAVNAFSQRAERNMQRLR